MDRLRAMSSAGSTMERIRAALQRQKSADSASIYSQDGDQPSPQTALPTQDDKHIPSHLEYESQLALSVYECTRLIRQGYTFSEDRSEAEKHGFNRLLIIQATLLGMFHQTEKLVHAVSLMKPTTALPLAKALHAQEVLLLETFHALHRIVWQGRVMTEEDLDEFEGEMEHIPWLRPNQQLTRCRDNHHPKESEARKTCRKPEDYTIITFGVLRLRIYLDSKIQELQSRAIISGEVELAPNTRGNQELSLQELEKSYELLTDRFLPMTLNHQISDVPVFRASVDSVTRFQLDLEDDDLKELTKLVTSSVENATEVHMLREAILHMREERDDAIRQNALQPVDPQAAPITPPRVSTQALNNFYRGSVLEYDLADMDELRWVREQHQAAMNREREELEASRAQLVAREQQVIYVEARLAEEQEARERRIESDEARLEELESREEQIKIDEARLKKLEAAKAAMLARLTTTTVAEQSSRPIEPPQSTRAAEMQEPQGQPVGLAGSPNIRGQQQNNSELQLPEQGSPAPSPAPALPAAREARISITGREVVKRQGLPEVAELPTAAARLRHSGSQAVAERSTAPAIGERRPNLSGSSTVDGSGPVVSTTPAAEEFGRNVSGREVAERPGTPAVAEIQAAAARLRPSASQASVQRPMTPATREQRLTPQKPEAFDRNGLAASTIPTAVVQPRIPSGRQADSQRPTTPALAAQISVGDVRVIAAQLRKVEARPATPARLSNTPLVQLRSVSEQVRPATPSLSGTGEQRRNFSSGQAFRSATPGTGSSSKVRNLLSKFESSPASPTERKPIFSLVKTRGQAGVSGIPSSPSGNRASPHTPGRLTGLRNGHVRQSSIPVPVQRSLVPASQSPQPDRGLEEIEEPSPESTTPSSPHPASDHDVTEDLSPSSPNLSPAHSEIDCEEVDDQASENVQETDEEPLTLSPALPVSVQDAVGEFLPVSPPSPEQPESDSGYFQETPSPVSRTGHQEADIDHEAKRKLIQARIDALIRPQAVPQRPVSSLRPDQDAATPMRSIARPVVPHEPRTPHQPMAYHLQTAFQAREMNHGGQTRTQSQQGSNHADLTGSDCESEDYGPAPPIPSRNSARSQGTINFPGSGQGGNFGMSHVADQDDSDCEPIPEPIPAEEEKVVGKVRNGRPQVVDGLGNHSGRSQQLDTMSSREHGSSNSLAATSRNLNMRVNQAKHGRHQAVDFRGYVDGITSQKTTRHIDASLCVDERPVYKNPEYQNREDLRHAQSPGFGIYTGSMSARHPTAGQSALDALNTTSSFGNDSRAGGAHGNTHMNSFNQQHGRRPDTSGPSWYGHAHPAIPGALNEFPEESHRMGCVATGLRTDENAFNKGSGGRGFDREEAGGSHNGIYSSATSGSDNESEETLHNRGPSAVVGLASYDYEHARSRYTETAEDRDDEYHSFVRATSRLDMSRQGSREPMSRHGMVETPESDEGNSSFQMGTPFREEGPPRLQDGPQHLPPMRQLSAQGTREASNQRTDEADSPEPAGLLKKGKGTLKSAWRKMKN